MKKLLVLAVASFLILSFSVSTSSCRRKIDNVDTTKTNTERKIGYLFYTSFISEYNQSLFDAFTRFKNAGVTDLIVDLRYNHGGSLSAASYLASLIAPKNAVSAQSVFTQLDYNQGLNNYFAQQNWSRATKLRETGSADRDPLEANLNLKTVYIIATSDSYSAAELLTFCLRPYMKVVHVGDSTGGKFTASFTVTAFSSYGRRTNSIYDSTKLSASVKDSLRYWAMQPIVAIYKDSRNNDFSVPGKLVPDIYVQSRENDQTAYKPLGDLTDYLLSTAYSAVTGTANTSGTQISPTISRSVVDMKPANLYVAKDALFRESVNWTAPVNAASTAITAPSGVNVITQFVYDGMSAFYKWSDYIETVSKGGPAATDVDPKKYFNRILYPLDVQHGWSWITEDVNSLLADFSGTPVDFGWALNLFWADANKSRIIAVVKYVYPNTPAAKAGIVRGDAITQINGNNITNKPSDAGYYMRLFAQDMINVTTGSKTVSITPVTIATNPVLKDTVYTVKK